MASSSPLLKTRCRVPHCSLWFGQALLYEDRVCIQGWTWRGRYRQVVPLERIEEVKWWAVLDEVNFLLRLDNGQAVPLHLRSGAGTWNVKLHSLLGKSMLARSPLPDTNKQAEETRPSKVE